MIPKLIDSVCNLIISGDEIIIITMISIYFQVRNNIDEKFVKNFLLTFLGDNAFFDKRCLRLYFYLISKKWLYRLLTGFVICDVSRINITKEILHFTTNQTYIEIALLIICLSINVTFCV